MLSRKRRPVVLYDYGKVPGEPPKLAKDTQAILVDHVEAGEGVAMYLASLGHRRIAFFQFSEGGRWARQHFQGVQRGLRRLLRGLRGLWGL